MTAITYTAQRSLSAGHVQGAEYSTSIRLASLEHDRDILKNTARALSGRTETLLIRNKRIWRVTSAILIGGELELMREFLQSVVSGETFSFDEFGYESSPNEPVDVILDGTYSESRALRQGDGGAKDGFRFSFTCREL